MHLQIYTHKQSGRKLVIQTVKRSGMKCVAVVVAAGFFHDTKSNKRILEINMNLWSG